MEGKTVIMTVILLSLVLAQGEPREYICCQLPNTSPPTGIPCKNISWSMCTKYPQCRLYVGNICPTVRNPSAAIHEYCKLGCESSVCNTISTVQKSGDEEMANELVGQCNNACSAFCTKGSTLASI